MPPAALAVAASARAPASRRARVPRAPTRSRTPLAPLPVPVPARRAVVAAAADGPHTGIVDEASVHDSSLVSTGLAPRRPASSDAPLCEQIGIQGVHHVAVIVESLQRSMDFYVGLLGLPLNPDRPHDRLPYDGAWLMMGPEMIHLMELPNPDPTNLEFRPEHGGKDRHFCTAFETSRRSSPRWSERGYRTPPVEADDPPSSSGIRTVTRWRWWRG